MGTRRLGDRPWLIHGDDGAELRTLKAELLGSRPAEVFATERGLQESAESYDEALASTKRLIDEAVGLEAVADHRDDEPLVAMSRLVAEDLCLLRRAERRWTLAAACVCFPSRWRLSDKIGRGITEIHGPVDGYADALADRVTSLFDALGPQPVWRRNWFIHPDDAWFQPDRPPGGDPVITADGVADELFIRSERQTLRAVVDGWILFTIRVQQARLGEVLDDPDRRGALAEWVATTPAPERARRGVGRAQAAELVVATAGD